MLWTDEASFHTGETKNQWTTRRAGEEYDMAHIVPNFRKGKGIMVWRAIAKGFNHPCMSLTCARRTKKTTSGTPNRQSQLESIMSRS